MKIVELSVGRPQVTILAFLLAGALGVSSLLSIPQSEDPVFPIPTFAVVAVLPGATPVDLEQLVVDPIEEKLSELDQLKSIKTSVEDGLAVLRVEFDAAADASKRHDDVLREINALRPSLPPDLLQLDVNKFDASHVNIVQIAVVSESRPYADLEREARRLADRIERVSGVKTVERWAVPARELRVDLDLGRLAVLGIPAGAVLGALSGENANVPGGASGVGDRRFSVKTSGSLRAIGDVTSTIVGGTGQSAVRLDQVATVRWGHEEPRHLGRYNGTRAAFVTAQMKPGQRIGAVRDQIYAELDRFEPTLMSGMVLERGFDQSKNVAKRIGRLGFDFAIALVLVLVTLLPLGLRASLIVMISIPLSLAIGVSLLKVFGYSINQLSVVGFVIALGLLVDDSIVVVENIARTIRQGVSRQQAAIRATRQIALAVLGCTAILIAAFLPILFLPGNAGKFIRSLPMAVVLTVLASLVVSVTIVPFLASVGLKESESHDGNRFMRALNWLIDRTYGPWLHRALERPKTVLAGAALLIVTSFGLVPLIGFSLFPKADTPQFLVRIETPSGASLAETDRVARRVEAVLRSAPEIRSIFMNVGRGNPDVYYNIIPRHEKVTVAEAFVLLHEFDPDRTPALFARLQAEFDEVPGASIDVTPFENGPPIEAPIAMRLLGPDLDTLAVLAAKMERTMVAMEGVRNVVNPLARRSTDVKVTVDRGRSGLLGVPTIEVDRGVRMALAGLEVGTVREADGEDYVVRVRQSAPAGTGAAGLDATAAPTALQGVYVGGFGGSAVRLSQVAAIGFEGSVSEIQHYNKERSVLVTAQVRAGQNTDRLTKALLSELDRWTLPTGYRLQPAGEIESRQESFAGLTGAILVAVFLTLVILILEFRTFRMTLVVATVIPLGIVGGLVALWIGGHTLSFTAMIGFIALIGIEIKNSILLVDFTNQLREEGVPMLEAIERAGRVRFVPIVLTTLTAVGGLLPLALQGSSLYSPLAQVIIGGLVSSTLLARLVTPVAYRQLTR